MKLFTIKDIIKYNSPCKSCERTTNFYFKTVPTEHDEFESTGSPIKPETSNGILSFVLSTKYKSRLTMVVNPLTNKFSLQSNAKEPHEFFTEFQNTTYLLAESTCQNCGTIVTSDFFEYDGDTIKPITLFSETIFITGPTHKFTISTSFRTNKSFVVADIISKPTPIHPFTIDIPAIPLFKFKGRDAILKKMKLILTFS